MKETVLASTGGAQQPWESNGLARRIYLTGQAKVSQAPPATIVGSEAKVSQPPPATTVGTEAERVWALVKDTNNVSILEEFIKRYGDTFFATLARTRLEELRKQQTAVVVPPPAPQAKPSPEPPPINPGWLGVKIQNIDKDTAATLGLSEPKGALVTEVITPGPAAEAGLKNGDAILSVNGSAVADSRDLARQIAGFSPDTKVDVRILRGQREQTLAVKLGELPSGKELARGESGESSPQPPREIAHSTRMGSPLDGKWQVVYSGNDYCTHSRHNVEQWTVTNGMMVVQAGARATLSNDGKFHVRWPWLNHPGRVFVVRAKISGSRGKGVFQLEGRQCGGTLTLTRM